MQDSTGKNEAGKHGEKMIAPIVICIFLCLYFIGIVIFCMFVPTPIIVKVLLVIIPLALAGVSLYVCIQRMNEIRSGEEDDLSKY